ncbi:MAG: extracellular solute-binding protein [Ornithinimicrobium sp.]
MPNAANLIDALASPPFDPERQYSLPWQAGLTGIGTNVEAAGREITTIEELLTARDLRGRVTVLSDFTDTIPLIMLELGIDPEDFSQAEYQQALDKLATALDVGQIRQITGNEYAPQLAKGDIAAAMAWSGDVIQLQFEDADVAFNLPEKGGMLWSDNMQIPVLAEHKENAEKLMDFYYDPVVAAEVAAWVNYICPVKGAQEAMADIDPELADNELIFPSEDTLAQVHEFKVMPWDEREDLLEQFNRVVGL